MLDQTRDRVDEIEGGCNENTHKRAERPADQQGLHRQSELTVKEPFRVMFGKEAGRTVVDVIGLGGSFVPAEKDGDDDDDGNGDGEDKVAEKEIVLETSVRMV